MTQVNEQDVRVTLLDSLLKTPHGNLKADVSTHQSILDQDPIFYPHLAMWYKQNGSVRDHQVLFSAMLATSRVEDMLAVHRATGQHLLTKLPPYQVANAVRFIKEDLGVNVPRSLRNTIHDYLQQIESNHNRFDSAALSGRRDMKYLYATLRIAPSERAQQILFDDTPPEGSKPWAVKQAAAASDVNEKARIIVDNKLPWSVATSLVPPSNPVGMAALITVMTPAQVINNLAAIKRSGGMDNEDVRSVVDQKLAAAKKDKRVSAYKTKVAKQAAQVDPEAEAALEEVREAQVAAKGEITKRTALLVDISGSQVDGIKVTKTLAPMIAGICKSDLHVIAFNTAVYPVPKPKDMSILGMEKAMAGLRASGGTSCGLPLVWMANEGLAVDQVVYVTDEAENNSPRFNQAYEHYQSTIGISPTVIIIRVGGYLTDYLQRSCQKMGIDYNAITFDGDYYSLPNIIPYLTGKSRYELVMEIMNTPLPVNGRVN